MKYIVVDSSVAVKWINSQDEENVERADKLIAAIQLGKVLLCMPELAKYEIGNAVRYKTLPIVQAIPSLSLIYKLPIQFYTMDEQMATRALEVAREFEITYYDASFIVLAEKLKSKLVTANYKHQSRYKGIVTIIDLATY